MTDLHYAHSRGIHPCCLTRKVQISLGERGVVKPGLTMSCSLIQLEIRDSVAQISQRGGLADHRIFFKIFHFDFLACLSFFAKKFRQVGLN